MTLEQALIERDQWRENWQEMNKENIALKRQIENLEKKLADIQEILTPSTEPEPEKKPGPWENRPSKINPNLKK